MGAFTGPFCQSKILRNVKKIKRKDHMSIGAYMYDANIYIKVHVHMHALSGRGD